VTQSSAEKETTMRIGRIEAFAVRYPESNNDGKIRSLTLVRVETDDGIVGWGEAITGGQEVSLAVRFVVERRLAPLVVGRDPRDVAGAWSAMRDATYWDGNGGIVTFGISAIDMALWDVAGKAAGLPLHALLGGRRRERVPACASTIFAMDDPERVGREFASFAAQGYRFVKGGWGHDVGIGFGRDERRDLSVARAVREAVGPDVEMICDVVALAGWDAPHAIRMARRLHDEVRLYWLEDPLLEHDLDGYRLLRQSVDVRICTGEKGWHAAHYKGLIESGAVDVIMVDPGRAEGVTGTWAIINMAASAGRSWNAHSWSSALNTAASLHLAVAAPNTLIFELKPVPSPMQHELVTTPIEQTDGWVSPPGGPGLGVEVDEAVVRGYGFTAADLAR
jgi:L-alanine-DL-glutamate epimerase-like enolase superfamily enzyme